MRRVAVHQLNAFLLTLILSGAPVALAQDAQQTPRVPEALAPSVTPPVAPPGEPVSYEGQPIRSIEFIGNRTLAEDTLLYYLALEPGEPFSRATLDRNVKRLWERDLIDDVTVEARPAEGGGVALVIRLVERPVVRAIEYEGLKRVNRSDLDDALSSQRVDLTEGSPLNLGELHRVKAVVQDLYAQKGYRFARAEYRLEPVPEAANERRVIFTIDEGDRVRIGDLRFEGNTVFAEARLRWQMKKTKESGLITRTLKHDIYNPASLAEDLDKVRDLYRKIGYKNAVIGEPRIEVTEARGGEEARRRLVITIPIDEGERWRIGDVSIEGNEIYEDRTLLSVFRYRPGKWLRAKTIDEGVEAVQKVYQNTGYIQARVAPELVERDGLVADLVVHVEEGELFRVGRIEFEGNTRTRDKVLRREMRIQEGRVMSLGALRNSLLKIRQLGYFDLQEEEPIRFDFQDGNTVDLTVQGTEADRTELQFGAGYSEGFGYFGQFTMRTQNFLGRGEQLGVNLQSGALTEYYELSYFIPWFLDRPQTAGFQAFSRELDFDIFAGQREIQTTTGGTVTYGRNLALFQSMSVAYSRLDQQFLQRVTNLDGELVEFDFDQEISSLRPAYSFNSVDNRFEPRRGTRFSAAIEYAGGVLGGTEYFLRPTVTYNTFRPVTGYPFETVAALNIEGGLIESFGGRELARFNLFRLGGESSVRGFERFQLYARDPETGKLLRDENEFPIGGDRYVQANLEYHFLLSGPFRVITFIDAGNVYAPGQSFDLARLRYSAGVELRITLPVLGGAPLRFIYAFNPNEKPDDQFNAFSFSIGSTF